NPGASALSNRKLYLRFKGSDFGEVYHDPERDADIDPIVSSKVRLYFQSIANSATVTYKIYGINPDYDDWTEDSLTWNGSDGIAAEYISSVSIKQSTFSESWVEFDVTSFVRSHRDAEYLSFYIEADLCAAIISSRDIEGQEPTLRTTGYIPDAPVTLRSMAEINGVMTDIAEPLQLKGKLGNPFEYQSSIPNPIYYPEADPDGIYYYDFVTQPTPPSEEEKDPSLYIDSLEESDNEIVVKYVRRDIKEVKATEAETYQGVKPTLPETVTAVLDNGTERIENVTWNWKEVSFPDYSTKGVFTMTGTVEHTDIPAVAEVTVYQAYYGDASYQTMNEFDLEAETTYRLSFELTNTDNLSDFLDEIFISYGGGFSLAYDMSAAKFREYLKTFGEGETVEVFFTTPKSESAITMYLPDCVYYMTNAELRPVLGRGGDMTVHYLFGDKEIYSQPVNVAFGEAYSLPEEYFTILDGAYTVTGVDADRSAIGSLTESVVVNSDGMEIYLICKASPVFTLNTAVENASDVNGGRFTRSTVTAFNGTSTDKSATVIVAKFGSDGKLTSVESNEIKIPAGATEAVTDTKITQVDKESYTTLLVWDDFNGLNPFETKVDSRNPTGESKKPETGDFILVPAMSRNVTASAQQSGNEAVNMLTRDLTTRWSAQAVDGEPVYADIDLENIYNVHTVGLGFYCGKSRYSRFAVEVSEDGEEWTAVVNPRYSSGKTNSIEYFTFNPVPARYIRVKGYGWKANEITDEGLVENTGDWFSLTAFEAYGPLNENSDIFISESNDFEGLGGTVLSSDLSAYAGNWGADALNEMTYTDYTPASGSSLYADIVSTPSVDGFAEGNTALRLYDNVDRDGGEDEGAGSIGAFHKLDIPSESYKIRFKWYVPNTIEGSTYNAQWAGVTLSAGRVKGGADTSNPVALQLRLSPSGKNKMAFNILRSITYNEGSQVSLLGSSSAFKANCVWDVMLDVDSESNSVIVTVSDGSRTESAFVRYGLYNSERTICQTWYNSSVNYLMFNTGAGGKCEMYVDDLMVTAIPDRSAESGTVTFSQDYNDEPSGTKIRDEAVCDTTSALIKESGQEYTPSYGTMLDVSIDTQSMTGGRALHLKDFVARENDSVKGTGGVFAYVDIPELSSTNITKISFDMYAPTYGEYAGFALGHGHNEG
ncbi:MAG: discoidin domain-containing protein, partial [Clostridia bacterium]